MSINVLQLADELRTEGDAYAYLERMRWGTSSPACPHCGTIDKHYFLKPKNGTSRKTRTGTATERRVWKCKACRKQFTVLTGTIFHGTKIPVRTWLFVIFEMCASKNGVAAREIERKYSLTPKSAWFMCHRIREAMKREPMAGLLTGRVVADETWYGGKPSNRKGHDSRGSAKGKHDRTPIMSLVSRETGEVRSQVIPNVKAETLRSVLHAHTKPDETHLQTDLLPSYKPVGRDFAQHTTVDHEAHQYVRDGATTNHAEGYFSQLKRSLDGTYHSVSIQHLDRYLAEFDYRHTTCKMTDTERIGALVGRVAGRRLTYRQPASS